MGGGEAAKSKPAALTPKAAAPADTLHDPEIRGGRGREKLGVVGGFCRGRGR